MSGIGDVVGCIVSSCNSGLLNTHKSITLRGGGIHHLVDTCGISDEPEVVIVNAYQLVDVPNAVGDLLNRCSLETSFGVLTSVVEDTRLLVNVMEFQRLEVSALSELHIFKTLDVDDQTVRLCLSNSLLDLEVSKLEHIRETDA